MDLSFYPLTMEGVDQADAEALCLFIGSDERPLTGLAGLADWRLCGRLSRMIRSGVLTGSSGEALLTPPGTRLSFKKLFLFGLGDARTEDELAGRVSDALRRLAQAGVRDAALQLPAKLPPERGVRTLMEGDGALARARVRGRARQARHVAVAILGGSAGRAARREGCFASQGIAATPDEQAPDAGARHAGSLAIRDDAAVRAAASSGCAARRAAASAAVRPSAAEAACLAGQEAPLTVARSARRPQLRRRAEFVRSRSAP